LVNRVLLHGDDEVTAHINEIPNTSSLVGSPDTPANRRLRQMRMRRVAFETAQSARRDRPLEVPKELQRMGYEPPARSRPFPQLKVFRDHRETKKKIAQLEKAVQESLAGSARHIREINRARAAREAEERTGIGTW
jgi:septal ring factor EnvC (AmiA/AmiB activator)